MSVAGLGRALLGSLAAHCAAEGIGRIDLTTEDRNEGRAAFHERLGAAHNPNKVMLRFDRGRLADLAAPG